MSERHTEDDWDEDLEAEAAIGSAVNWGLILGLCFCVVMWMAVKMLLALINGGLI